MATLQKIRTKAGLLVAIVIGLSLAAFILGDMFRSGSSVFRKNQLRIGEIDGKSIQYPDFQQEVEKLAEIYKMNTRQSQLDENTWVQLREQTWQNLINEKVMGDVYDKLGIAVSPDELFDMLQGSNLHPIVQQLFRNPNTGQIDRNAIVSFLKNLDTGVDPEQRQYWLHLEKQIVKDRVQTKYSKMVGKGLFVTSEEAQSSLSARNKQINFDYVLLSNRSVADSQVVVTPKDLKHYYNEHKESYKQETTRRIEYVSFPVEPSKADFKSAEEWIDDIKPDFGSATDNVQFVNSNSDLSFDDTWFKQADLPENIGNWVYEEKADTNDVLGPYFEDGAYKLAKLNTIGMLPDSVEARHILLSANTPAEGAAMKTLADSLKTAIEDGSDFATLARKYSKDQGSATQGGDLGWFKRGQMVKPFEEAAFSNKVNEVSVVASQYGFHVIQTTARGKLSKQVQVAFLVRKVQPSTQTYQDTYAQASKFAGENTDREEFDAAITEQKLAKKVANVGENDRMIVGLENPRQLIRAAYGAEEGDIILSQEETPIFELGDNFVIALLAHVTEEGIAPLEEVHARVELAVLKEKKAGLLKEKATAALEGDSDLHSIAGKLNTTVEKASDINFNSFQLSGVGLEPAVIGTASSLEVNQVSKPIVGNNGVFIVQVTSVNNPENMQDVASEQNRLAQSISYRTGSQVIKAHEDAVEIIDKRSKFY